MSQGEAPYQIGWPVYSKIDYGKSPSGLTEVVALKNPPSLDHFVLDLAHHLMIGWQLRCVLGDGGPRPTAILQREVSQATRLRRKSRVQAVPDVLTGEEDDEPDPTEPGVPQPGVPEATDAVRLRPDSGGEAPVPHKRRRGRPRNSSKGIDLSF